MAMNTINKDGTKRTLHNRHVQMIAIGGTIGTGLFLGAGNSIAKTGPSIIIVYAVLGLFFFLMMRAIGEMLYASPEEHTFVAFITKYLGIGPGVFAAWSYWLGLIFLAMAELTAISTYVQYWFPTWNTSLIQIIFLIILGAVNLIAAKIFGEAEFWFAMIKIIAIIALIAVGLMMIFTGFKDTSGVQASFGNIFHKFQMFPNGITSFVAAFPMVFFAFQGIEFVSITIGETENPRKVLPKAVNQTIYRILIFYIGAMLIIMSINPWREINPAQSPFVQVFKLAGLPAAAAVINFVVLTSAASALNSAIFSAGRHLYTLSMESEAAMMKPFRHISKTGVPSGGILLSVALMFISPIISAIPQITSAFEFVTSVSSDLYILVYGLAMLAHRQYKKSQDFMSDGFLMPAYRVTSPATIVFFAVIFISLFFNPGSVVPAIGAIIWCIIFGGATWLRYRKTPAAVIKEK
ncbi:MAG: amino acid permease [Lactobacillus sp.]|jgi:AAT family amino acid transporter|nr:amino acid permease [Lactobacillus sp.]